MGRGERGRRRKRSREKGCQRCDEKENEKLLKEREGGEEVGDQGRGWFWGGRGNTEGSQGGSRDRGRERDRKERGEEGDPGRNSEKNKKLPENRV
jgi:hypothetical protein